MKTTQQCWRQKCISEYFCLVKIKARQRQQQKILDLHRKFFCILISCYFYDEFWVWGQVTAEPLGGNPTPWLCSWSDFGSATSDATWARRPHTYFKIFWKNIRKWRRGVYLCWSEWLLRLSVRNTLLLWIFALSLINVLQKLCKPLDLFDGSFKTPKKTQACCSFPQSLSLTHQLLVQLALWGRKGKCEQNSLESFGTLGLPDVIALQRQLAARDLDEVLGKQAYARRANFRTCLIFAAVGDCLQKQL